MKTFKQAKSDILANINAAVVIRSWSDVGYYQNILNNREQDKNPPSVKDCINRLDNEEWVNVSKETFKLIKDYTVTSNVDYLIIAKGDNLDIKYV